MHMARAALIAQQKVLVATHYVLRPYLGSESQIKTVSERARA